MEIMDTAELSNIIDAAVSVIKSAINGAQGLLAMVVTLVLTSSKLAALLASKKKLYEDFPPGTVSYT